MEVEGYVLEGIPRLKCLSITEIVLGILGALGALGSVAEIPVSMAIELLFDVLVIATGAYGVHTIKALHKGQVLSRRFSHLMKLNLLVVIVQCLEICMIVIAGVMWASGSAHATRHFIPETVILSYAESEHSDAQERARARVTGVTIGVAAAMFLALIFIIISALAARISRENLKITHAGPGMPVAAHAMGPGPFGQFREDKEDY